MNTRSTHVPFLEANGEPVDYYLEDLELASIRSHTKMIVKMWESGKDEFEIAERMNRDPDEIFICLFDQARKRKLKRPYLYRRKRTG
ncbi:hypothetical protein Pryu01_03037 [Paraliobacillus ryukyuensis]|uniref:Uncharacterized protein n=1 Tax=Paraliobacillus ryukyuensis TaxID=200904 RepID=A0A366DSU2_9BACI|nr:hypothetical protein [Paraliobacillus ryukyuensis]RBO92268.1 hypothetical protein DES48_1156 [Paraliobacillus ryukyuensis]